MKNSKYSKCGCRLYQAVEVSNGKVLVYDVRKWNDKKNHWSLEDCTVLKFENAESFCQWYNEDLRIGNCNITTADFDGEYNFVTGKL